MNQSKKRNAQNNIGNYKDVNGLCLQLYSLLTYAQIQITIINYLLKQKHKDFKTRRKNNRALKFQKLLSLIEEDCNSNADSFMQRHLSRKAKIKARSITITVGVALFFAPAISFAVNSILKSSSNEVQNLNIIVLMLLAILLIVAFLTFELILLKKSEYTILMEELAIQKIKESKENNE